MQLHILYYSVIVYHKSRKSVTGIPKKRVLDLIRLVRWGGEYFQFKYFTVNLE